MSCYATNPVYNDNSNNGSSKNNYLVAFRITRVKNKNKRNNYSSPVAGIRIKENYFLYVICPQNRSIDIEVKM